MIFGLLQPASDQFWARFGFPILATRSSLLEDPFFSTYWPTAGLFFRLNRQQL